MLQDANALHLVQAGIEAGEMARVLPHVPLNITIVDNRWPLVGARAEVRREPGFGAIGVHDSPLPAGLARIFDALWRIAVPITGGTELNDVTAWAEPGRQAAADLSERRSDRRVDRPGVRGE
ncbi:hypothetical protein E1218_24205 [Kribbella turkmenica]|uniref:Uncharacterized protein n=1 Tax=Kribbella turkmenica TaxID=2530375 RepID=A0A4V2YEH6_9ACTN|nr:hypothetical protein [Kribbella turkmenica]TDD19346.1 hypothetical protein E1218_24205 [Kribbella turkmenica]